MNVRSRATDETVRMTEEEFIRARATLREFFKHESLSSGVPINPISRDNRTTKLIERLYEEEMPQRHFHVCIRSDDYPGLDAFWKKTGVDFEVIAGHIYQLR
jgi:hypothetical protein